MRIDFSQVECIQTHDGSPSVFVPALNERYHSIHGARQESQHVYIKQGIEALLQLTLQPTLCVLEIGFGTGLNAVLSRNFADSASIQIFYHTIEAYPMPAHIVTQLANAYPQEEQTHFELLHALEWEVQHQLNQNFHFRKFHMMLSDVDRLKLQADVVYFDAFAPNKQADMWTTEHFALLHSQMADTSVLVTYCCRGFVKRNLQEAGFRVEKVQGPPGKREMLRAWKGL